MIEVKWFSHLGNFNFHKVKHTYTHVCVCVYIYIHTYMCIYIYAHTPTQWHIISIPRYLLKKSEKKCGYKKTFLVAEMGKSLPAMPEDSVSIPGSGRFPGEGSGNPLQYPWLKNLMDRGTWWAIVHGVAKSWTWLNDQHTHKKTSVFV